MESQLGKPQTLSITAKLYLQYCKLQLVGYFKPQVSQLQLKDATTPWFLSATTPFLPATTGRRLQPHDLSATTERMLRKPIYHQLLE